MQGGWGAETVELSPRALLCLQLCREYLFPILLVSLHAAAGSVVVLSKVFCTALGRATAVQELQLTIFLQKLWQHVSATLPSASGYTTLTGIGVVHR